MLRRRPLTQYRRLVAPSASGREGGGGAEVGSIWFSHKIQGVQSTMTEPEDTVLLVA